MEKQFQHNRKKNSLKNHGVPVHSLTYCDYTLGFSDLVNAMDCEYFSMYAANKQGNELHGQFAMYLCV